VSGWRGWLLRRLVVAPLMPLLALLAAAMWALTLLGSAVVCPLLALLRGDAPRWRLLRAVSFAVLYLVGETLCLLVCLVLWLASGAGRGIRAGPFVRAHRALLGCFLGLLVAAARPIFGFRLIVEEPAHHPEDLRRAQGAAPVLVLARHAGPGASFALVHLLLTRYHRHPRVVLKEQLRLDPAVDVLLTRTGCTWVRSGPGTGDAAVVQVEQAAAGLQPRHVLVLFPEGADWTPVRHLQAVARLRGRGMLREAQAALRMPHVLPPRPAGTVAALQAAPDADVLVFTHCGHDELLDAASAWQALPLQWPLQMAWWRAVSRDVPHDDAKAAGEWLQQTWADIDAWVCEQQDLARLGVTGGWRDAAEAGER